SAEAIRGYLIVGMAERRAQRQVALLGFALAVILLAFELGRADRLPLSWTLVVLGFVGVHLGAGFLLGTWRWLFLAFAQVAVAVAAAALAQNGLLLIFSVITLVPLAAALLAAGIGARKLAGRKRAALGAAGAWIA